MSIKKRRIYQYISRFGLYYGLKLFFTVRRSKSKDIIRFTIPHLEHEIFLRRGTSDFMVFEEIFIDRRYLIKPKSNVNYIIDAGANIGLASIYFQSLFPNAKIICIEPEHSNFHMLKLNTAKYGNIICYEYGLWNKKCLLKIINKNDGNWAFMVKETSDHKNAVQALSVDDILAEYPTDKIDILKIDIEGSEKEVFEKNNNWISITDNIIVEIHENMREGATNAVMQTLKNFDHFQVFENHYFQKKSDIQPIQTNS